MAWLQLRSFTGRKPRAEISAATAASCNFYGSFARCRTKRSSPRRSRRVGSRPRQLRTSAVKRFMHEQGGPGEGSPPRDCQEIALRLGCDSSIMGSAQIPTARRQ